MKHAETLVIGLGDDSYFGEITENINQIVILSLQNLLKNRLVSNYK
jgi:hypothetical protein